MKANLKSLFASALVAGTIVAGTLTAAIAASVENGTPVVPGTCVSEAHGIHGQPAIANATRGAADLPRLEPEPLPIEPEPSPRPEPSPVPEPQVDPQPALSPDLDPLPAEPMPVAPANFLPLLP